MKEIVLLNHPKVIDYYKEDTHNKIGVLTADDIDKVRRNFGRASRRWRGEFQFHVWDMKFEGYKFSIWSAKKKGTGYQIEYDGDYNDFIQDDKVGDVAVKFMKSVYSKLGDNNETNRNL